MQLGAATLRTRDQDPLPTPQHHCGGVGTATWGQPCHPTNGGSQGSRTPGSSGTAQAPNAAVGRDGDEAATPTYPAQLRVAADPRGVLYRASAALCPPRPRCRVSRCSQAHGHRPAADVFPSSRLLPPRMGSGPNPALAANPCPHRAVGTQDGTPGSRSMFAPQGLGLEYHLDHSRGAGRVPSPKCIPYSALPWWGWGCTRDRNVVPIIVPIVPGSAARPSCGTRAGLTPHRVRVVTQPPADIIPINSGLCEN